MIGHRLIFGRNTDGLLALAHRPEIHDEHIVDTIVCPSASGRGFPLNGFGGFAIFWRERTEAFLARFGCLRGCCCSGRTGIVSARVAGIGFAFRRADRGAHLRHRVLEAEPLLLCAFCSCCGCRCCPVATSRATIGTSCPAVCTEIVDHGSVCTSIMG